LADKLGPPKAERREEEDRTGEWAALLLSPLDIPLWWSELEPGVKNVREKSSHTGSVTWKPEDVYAYLRVGQAWAYIALKDGKYAGFLIGGKARQDPFSSVKGMLIWIAWSKTRGAMEGILPIIEEWARDAGYTYMEMSSSRDGWVKRAPKIGFRMRERTYVKSLRKKVQ
jgi:hypothetical protein